MLTQAEIIWLLCEVECERFDRTLSGIMVDGVWRVRSDFVWDSHQFAATRCSEASRKCVWLVGAAECTRAKKWAQTLDHNEAVQVLMDLGLLKD